MPIVVSVRLNRCQLPHDRVLSLPSPPSPPLPFQRQGFGKLTSKSMGTYEGSWERDVRHGRGKLVYPNGDVYDGGWELGKVCVVGVVCHVSGCGLSSV